LGFDSGISRVGSGELNLNINECQFRHWEERMFKPVVVPIGINSSTFHDPVNQGVGPQTLICCSMTAGDAYCPVLVSSDPVVCQVFDQ
jgi:hypothetical protein